MEERHSFVELCRRGSKSDVIKFLRRNGKEFANIKDSDYEQTPLHIVAEIGRADLSTYLIEKCKANVNAVDKNGWTPLHSSASSGNVEVLEILLKNGAFARALTNEGASPLHYFVRNPTSDPIVLHRVLKGFVANGADVNQQNKHGEAPLHQAAMRGRTQCVLYLLNHKADPNVITNNGETPLHFAARSGHKETMNVLLQWGADPTIDSPTTGGCLALSQKWKDAEMEQMLLEHFAAFGKEPPEPMVDRMVQLESECGEKDSGEKDSERSDPPSEDTSSSSSTSTRPNGRAARGRSEEREDKVSMLSADSTDSVEDCQSDELSDGAESHKRTEKLSEAPVNKSVESKKAKYSRGRSNSFTSVRAIRTTFEGSTHSHSPPQSPVQRRLRGTTTVAGSTAGASASASPTASAEDEVIERTGNKYGTPKVRKIRNKDKEKRNSRVGSLVRNFEKFAGIGDSSSSSSAPAVAVSDPQISNRKSSRSRRDSNKERRAEKKERDREREREREAKAEQKSSDKDRKGSNIKSLPNTEERTGSESGELSVGSVTTEELDKAFQAEQQPPQDTREEGHAAAPSGQVESPRAAREDLCPPRLPTKALSEEGRGLLKEGWTCCNCDEHRTIATPLSFFARGPDDWENLKEGRDKRTQLSSDVCSIDNVSFYIRGLLKININQEGAPDEQNYSPVFTFGLWVKVSNQDFFRALEDWSSGKKATYDGVLNNRLPLYPDTTGMKVRLACDNNGRRPAIEILTREHELVRDWKTGMSMRRFEKMLKALLD